MSVTAIAGGILWLSAVTICQPIYFDSPHDKAERDPMVLVIGAGEKKVGEKCVQLGIKEDGTVVWRTEKEPKKEIDYPTFHNGFIFQPFSPIR